MADIHIDLNAGTDGAGTATDPRNVIPSSAVIAAAGNVIKFKRGMNATLNYVVGDGESGVAYRYLSGTNLRVEAYYNSDGSDDPSYPKPIITPRVTDTSSISFLRFNSAGNGWTVRNIVFQDPICSQVLTCSNGGGANGILIEGVEVYDHLLNYETAASSVTTNSIVLGSSSPTTKATVRFCTIDGTNDDNLVFASAAGLVEYCLFKRPGQGNPTVIGDNISCSLSGAHGVYHIIRHNIFEILHASQKQCYLHNTATGAGGGGTSYLEDNEFYLNTTSGESAAVAVSVGQTDGTGSIYTLYARRNKIYNANIAFFAVNGDIRGLIEGNLIVVTKATPSSSVAAVVQLSNTMEFSGNTVINTLGATGNTFQAAVDQNKLGTDTATVVKNNILKGWPIGVRKHQTAANCIEANNAYYDCTKNVTRRDTDATVTPGATVVTADPLLSSEYLPTIGSPVIGAGVHLRYSRDINRSQRPNPPSIGAYDLPTQRRVLDSDPAAW